MRSLRAALDRLRILRPGFYTANVTVHLERGEFFPALIAHTARDLGLDSTTTERFIRRIIRLVSSAGLEWAVRALVKEADAIDP